MEKIKMKKNVKTIAIGLMMIVLGFLGISFYYFNKESPLIIPKENIIFFYGRECPHCKDVENFLKENSIAERIPFDSIEIWHNKQNSNVLRSKANECGLLDDEIAVPFLYADGRCYVGTQSIEDFFTKIKSK